MHDPYDYPFDEQFEDVKDYREWSEMKAEGIEIETMQEYVDEVRGFHDYEPEPMDAYDYDREFGARDAYYEELDEDDDFLYGED